MKYAFDNFKEFAGTHYDFCVFGTGPAGMTLAMALSEDKSNRILLLEGGGDEYDENSQAIYSGSSSGRRYADLDATRLRQLGGSSNHWSGYCLPLSDHDFDRKDVGFTDPWPISSDSLRQHSAKASEILGLPVFGRDSDKPVLPGSEGLFRIGFGASSTVNFRDKYKSTIENSANIDLVLGANLVELLPDRISGRISSARIAPLSGDQHLDVRAERFILCLGGIENPRALLNSNSVIPSGLGNNHDLVGRYFADHLHLEFGWCVALDKQRVDALSHGKFIEPTPHFLRTHNIMNFGWEVSDVVSDEVSNNLIADFKEISCQSSLFRSLLDEVGQSIFCRRIKRPGVGRLRLVAECTPEFMSRVALAENVDRFGKRKIDLQWKLHERDRDLYAKTAKYVGQFFIRNNLGRIKIEPWVLDHSVDWPDRSSHELIGHHHIGTTKMANTPREGVVDPGCQVFGHENLYVCGSSVFPRGGYANPTYSIVELSLFLASKLMQA